VSDPLVLPLGEAAVTIRLAEIGGVEVAERAAELAESIRREGIDGVTEVVASIASVSVYYELRNANCELRTRGVRKVLGRSRELASSATAFATHVIPTRYDGPDLDSVAERVQMSRAAVILAHSSREYHVLAIGFLPGWGYLGPLDPALSLPRRTTPRTRVPAGSVAIAGAQTGVYPRVTPGGWHLIGSTDVVLFDPQRDPPSLLRAGDRVRFSPVG
jgi:KipI family sensor histidine kinase inhibitor